MLDYIEYLGLPAQLTILIVGVFLIMQIAGELLEFKGKVVPECMKIRKYFARKKAEKQFLKDAAATLEDVRRSLGEINAHYSTDNITMRDRWISYVNQRLDQYDENIAELGRKLDTNNSDTLSILIDNKRNSIIDFASLVIDEEKPVTKEQFNRIFKIYEEYEVLIKANGMTNGEVDIAIRIIREAYENHMRDHTFIEDIRGYNV